jgi:hypothetical protein
MGYVEAQMRFLANRFSNFIEFQTAAMLRGSYGQYRVGDHWANVFTATGAGSRTLDYQIPAANKSQLEMGTGANLVTASWATTSTDIPAQLRNISQAFVGLVGSPLKHIVLPPAVWALVLQNDEVQTQGGSAQTSFDVLPNIGIANRYRLKACPEFEITVYPTSFKLWDNSTQAMGTTLTAGLPATGAAFIAGEPSQWAKYLRAPEAIGTLGQQNSTFDIRYGVTVVTEQKSEPAGVEVRAYLNGLPSLTSPSALAFGTVVY